MAATTPIDIRTYGYYYPHGYIYLWLLLPLWIYALIATPASIDIRTHSYYCPHRYAYL